MSYVIHRAAPTLDYDGQYFLLKAPAYQAEALHQLAAASYDKRRGLFVLPGYLLYVNTVREMFPDLELTYQTEKALRGGFPLRSWPPVISAELNFVYNLLYTYQQEAVQWLYFGPHATGLVALSPGLGKTIVALMAAKLLDLKRVLVVAPKPLLRTWENEERKFFGTFTALVRHHGKAPSSGWVLTNYDTVVGPLLPQYLSVEWDAVILDESVLVKNRKTKRFKAMLMLRKVFPRKEKRWWELSGSPTTRYADDLWSQLHLQDPKGFSSYWRFAQRYCYVEQDVWGTKITGTRQNVDLRGDLADVMFVRNQQEVLSQLPEEIPQLVEVALNPKQLKAYREMEDDFITKLESGEEVKATIVLSQLIRLQEIASNLNNIGGEDDSAKADALVEMVEARSFEMPALVWTNWVPGARALTARLKQLKLDSGYLRVEWIHGAGTPREDRENEEKFEAYKRGEVDILILSIAVGKFGHTLTTTRTIVWHDLTWNADDFLQANHRVRRIGLDHRPLVIRLKAAGTVDELLEMNLFGKMKSISQVGSAELAAMLRNLTGKVDT